MSTEKEKEAGQTLTDNDIERIANKVVTELIKQGHNFYIDPENHYNSHRELDEFLKAWKEAKSIWTKIFLSAIGVGAIILIGISLIWGKKPLTGGP